MTVLLRRGVSSDWWESLEALRSKLHYFLTTATPDRDLSRLLSDTLARYSSSLRISSVPNAIAIVSGEYCSPFMSAFSWIGRWRPTTVTGLVHSVTSSAIRSDDTKANGPIIGRLATPIPPLSQSQLRSMKELEESIAQLESHLSDELRKLQTGIADANMVKALNLGRGEISGEAMVNGQRALDIKLTELQRLLSKADNLRVDSLRSLLNLLTPVQAAYCVLASLNLTFALRQLK